MPARVRVPRHCPTPPSPPARQEAQPDRHRGIASVAAWRRRGQFLDLAALTPDLIQDQALDGGLVTRQTPTLPQRTGFQAKRAISRSQPGTGGKGTIHRDLVCRDLGKVVAIGIVVPFRPLGKGREGCQPEIGSPVQRPCREDVHHRWQPQTLAVEIGQVSNLAWGADAAQQTRPVIGTGQRRYHDFDRRPAPSARKSAARLGRIRSKSTARAPASPPPGAWPCHARGCRRFPPAPSDRERGS